MGGMGGMEPHHMNGSLGEPAAPAQPCPGAFSLPQLLAQLGLVHSPGKIPRERYCQDRTLSAWNSVGFRWKRWEAPPRKSGQEAD